MRKTLPPLLAVLLAVLLAWGIYHLFAVRFSIGDIYPPYSSLRTDGLGAKVLYDALAEVAHTERNLRPTATLRGDGATTLFLLGTPQTRSWEDSDVEEIESLARGGMRIVISLLPLEKKPEPGPSPPEDKKSKPGKSVEKRKSKKAKEAERIHGTPALEVRLAFFSVAPEHARSALPGVEPEIAWHTAAYFDTPDSAWRTIYSVTGKPVLIERTLGKGSVVLSADSYPFSNEALSKRPAPRLLAALAGASDRVMFDETHLGLQEQPGVAALIRKFRLHGVAAALLLVAALAVWRNALPFVPPRPRAGGKDGAVPGRDAAAGFISLLMRNIPPRALVQNCVEEWKRSFGHRAGSAIIARAEALAQGGTRHPAQTFRAISELLSERKKWK